MTIPHSKYDLRRLLGAALALALVASLIAQPALAAGPLLLPQQAEKSHPDATNYRVTCANGECTIALDLGGEMRSTSVVPKDMPIKLDLPQGAVPFLSSGTSLEIGDRISLTLPFGTIRMDDGDFSLHLDEEGNLDRLHGKSTSIVPALNLGPNLKLGGPFGAEIGYDYGSTLSGLSTVLDPEKRYLFFHLGSGLELDASMPGGTASGGTASGEPMRFSIPENDVFSIVIDPESALLYLDGRVTLAQITDVGMLLGLMGLQPAAIPLLSGVVLPTRTTIGIGGLLSPDMDKNFIQITGGMGINGGPLARLLRIEGETLGIDGLLRVDSGGLLLGGVARSSVNPDRVLDTRGELSLYIPFSLEELPYVQVGGKLRVPVVGIETEIAQQIGGGPVSELTSSNALLESTAEAASAWWSKTGPWMSGVAGVVAGGTNSLLDALQDAAASTGESMSSGTKTVWNTVRDSTGKVIEGTGTAVGAGVDAAGNAIQAAGSAIGSGASVAGDALKGAGSAVGQGASGAAGAAAGAAGTAAGAAAGAASSAAGTAAGAAGAAAGVVSGAASGAAAGASAAWSSTAAAADCAAQQARNLWCRTTGRCEVEEVVCQ